METIIGIAEHAKDGRLIVKTGSANRWFNEHAEDVPDNTVVVCMYQTRSYTNRNGETRDFNALVHLAKVGSVADVIKSATPVTCTPVVRDAAPLPVNGDKMGVDGVAA